MRTSTQIFFSIMLDYMEKHGDISKPPPGSQGRLDNLQHWLELAELLNKARGESKPLEKWRKAWSDFKNNTKRKVRKIKNHPGEGLDLTEAETRLMKLLKKQNNSRRQLKVDDEFLLKEEMDLDNDEKNLSNHAQYFCSVNGPTRRRRKSRQSSFTSESSSSQHSTEKSNRHSNDVKEVTDKYFEFEREREKMAHEREMARIKQNDEIISIFGRMVSVFESLSPSIQSYLNRNVNGGG